MTAVGRRRWALPGGWMPLSGHGPEPEFTGFERIAVLNAGDRMASVRITAYYADRDPVGPYRLEVAAARMRAVRIGDLIFPEAPPLGVPVGLVVDSDEPVVVQCTRQDTRQAALALMGGIAHPA